MGEVGLGIWHWGLGGGVWPGGGTGDGGLGVGGGFWIVGLGRCWAFGTGALHVCCDESEARRRVRGQAVGGRLKAVRDARGAGGMALPWCQ